MAGGSRHGHLYIIQYLNTDIDLEAPFDLTELANILKDRGLWVLAVYPDEGGLWRATLEAAYNLAESNKHLAQPERTIQALLGVVDSLEGDGAELWRRCSRRVFDLGFDCGKEPWPFTCVVAPETLARIAAVGAELRVTIYPEAPPKPAKQNR